MIVVEDLVKIFPTTDGREKHAVDGLTLRVGQGRIYGLLGPNGAGKTTALRMLSGLITATSGTVTIAGYDVATDPQAVKRSIGFLTANTALYQRLTPRDVFRYFAELHGLDRDRANARAEALIGWLNMRDFADLRCGSLSTGQKQRTNIGRALVADPPVLIMDEPTLGLDVLSNRVILDFIKRARSEGKSIVLSTHYLDEAEDMCDEIGLLHNGRLVAEGTIAELREMTGVEPLSGIFLKIIGVDRAEALRTR